MYCLERSGFEKFPLASADERRGSYRGDSLPERAVCPAGREAVCRPLRLHEAQGPASIDGGRRAEAGNKHAQKEMTPHLSSRRMLTLTPRVERERNHQVKSGHLAMPAHPNNQTLPPFRQRDWRAGPGRETRARLMRTTPLRRVEFLNCSKLFCPVRKTDFVSPKDYS